jgi:hypothetical protein
MAAAAPTSFLEINRQLNQTIETLLTALASGPPQSPIPLARVAGAAHQAAGSDRDDREQEAAQVITARGPGATA